MENLDFDHIELLIPHWQDKIRSMFQKFEEVGKSKDHLQKIELPSDTDIAKAERLSINQKSGEYT